MTDGSSAPPEAGSATEPRPSYWGEYYASNKDRILQKKKNRYETDPEYREHVKQRARLSKKRIRQAINAERATAGPNRVRVPRHRKPIMIPGNTEPMFSAGYLARAICKSVPTLNSWEAKGLLPKTPYRSSRGDRLYTVGMIELVKAALSKRENELLRSDDLSFHAEVKEAWKKNGVKLLIEE